MENQAIVSALFFFWAFVLFLFDSPRLFLRTLLWENWENYNPSLFLFFLFLSKLPRCHFAMKVSHSEVPSKAGPKGDISQCPSLSLEQLSFWDP